MDSYAKILADARRDRTNALALLAKAETGGHLPHGVTMHGLQQSISDYDQIIQRLGFRDKT